MPATEIGLVSKQNNSANPETPEYDSAQTISNHESTETPSV